MARKQQLLHELLNEEQEPFHLKTYIADRRSQLTKISPKNNLQIIKKQKPIIDTSPTNVKRNSLCKNACLFTFQNSPGYRKSPFQSPCKSPNRAVFLRVPAKTAALLVEAAMRIQTKPSKRKTQINNVGLGLFGSILKRMKDRTKNKRRMPGVCDNEVKVSRKFEPKTDENIRISCSCDTWSSSNEEKSMNLETSNYSSCSEGSANGDISSGEKRFFSSPFRFSLQKSPSSSGHRTPEFSTPAASPSRHRKGEKANRGTKNSKQVRRGGEGGEDEDEEKDWFSPVSVLDPPFEEDNGQESADVDAGDYDLECSYANVIRAKQQLMYMLSRFEKLAELDPIELERKLLQGSDDDEPFAMYREHSVDTFALEVISKSNLQKTRKISADTKRRVSDLIIEQKSEMNCSNNINVAIFDTSVDTMIELSFKKELDRWTKFQEEEAEIAGEIEFGIFGLLVEELSEELCY